MAPFSDFLAGGVNDVRLKPRLLRALTRDLDDSGDKRSRGFAEEDLANALEKVRLHGLLSEVLVLPQGCKEKNEVKIREEWRSAVDTWVERLLLLVSDKMPQKCWAGTCLLGVTIEECTSERLVASYSLWFEKLLQNVQASSHNRFVYEASYACLSDLFTRLANFPNVKKESTSFAGRLVQPVIHSLEGDGSFVEAAIDLLCTLIKFYPSAVYRHYDKVESAVASKVLAGNSNMEILKKFSVALALLPYAKGDSGSWFTIMQKLLISINLLLNDAFEGLEDESTGREIMKLLAPAGKDTPSLWDQKSNTQFQATRRLRDLISPQLFSLTYSCCIMLTNPYPVQVTVPVRPLLTLIGRVLNVDGTLVTVPVRPLLTLIGRVLNVDGTLVSKTVLPSTTSLYQELLCSELPAFHLYILDLLIATIKGLKSQILPHAASVVQPLTDYFRRATLPSIRAKVYYTLEVLLHSMGVGMSLHLAEHVINNATLDLEEGHENSIPKLSNESSLKNSPKKRKRGRPSSQSNSVEEDTNFVVAEKKSAPLSVKIAALRAMETLLSVGGTLKSESWRLEADRLLINVAKRSLDAFTGKGGKYLCTREPATVQEEYSLVALQALLSSLLSPSHVRPPYLAQGFELFQKGKLEVGTKIATFCEKALVALEVLIHPRDIPLVNYPIPVAAPVSINEFDDDEMYTGWWGASDDEMQPVGNDNGDAQPQSMEVDVQKSNAVEQERIENNREPATLSIEPEKIGSSSFLPAALDSSHSQVAVDQVPTQDLQNRVNDQVPTQDLQNRVNDTRNTVSRDAIDDGSKESYHGILGSSSLKGKELMDYSDSDSDSLGPIPPIVDADPDTDSDLGSLGAIPPIVDADPDTDSD